MKTVLLREPFLRIDKRKIFDCILCKLNELFFTARVIRSHLDFRTPIKKGENWSEIFSFVLTNKHVHYNYLNCNALYFCSTRYKNFGHIKRFDLHVNKHFFFFATVAVVRKIMKNNFHIMHRRSTLKIEKKKYYFTIKHMYLSTRIIVFTP